MGFLSNILSASEDKELSKIKFLVTMIACDGEVTPDVGATGSHYTNGIGHGKHTFNLLG